MKFKVFVSYLGKLEETASRNEMAVLLAALFKKAEIEEIDKICYLSLGRLLPKFAGLEFQMAERTVIRAIALAYQVEEKKVKQEYKKRGDLGLVVSACRSRSGTKFSRSSIRLPRFAGDRSPLRQKDASGLAGSDNDSLRKFVPSRLLSRSLSVLDVYNKLMKIAQEAGEGSVERKINGLAELLRNLDPLSAKYLVRIPLGRLRLGFSDMTILDALSWMGRADKSLRGSLERAFNASADIGLIAKEFKKSGLLALKKIRVKPGIPIRPQQAERLPSAAKIMEKLGRCAVEYKLDGLRMQLHVWRREKFGRVYGRQQPASAAPPCLADRQVLGSSTPKSASTEGRLLGRLPLEVRIFSRNLENTTHMFPEVVAGARKLMSSSGYLVSSLILDGEAIGVDKKTGKFLPFQETTKRKRKHGISEIAQKIPVKYFVFDCLYFNGQELLSKPFWQRRKILEKVMADF